MLYLRQSVSRDESISLELQESAGREYCARMGYDIVDVLADPDRTGRTWRRRPAVAKTLSMVEDGQASVVVLWKWSRLSRNRKDWAVAQDRAEIAGGRIESATEPIDVTTAAGRFSRGVLIEMAVFDSERIGETWREVHQSRVARGVPHSGKAKFGYQYDRVSGFRPDPVTGPILGDLYRRYAAGESAEKLCTLLYHLDVKSTAGQTFAQQGLLRMLDTGFGAGYFSYGGQQLRGIHEPVITEAEWLAFRAKREERRNIPSRSKGSMYPLSGLVRCMKCGGRMHPSEYGAAKTLKYRCETRAKRGALWCEGGYVAALHLEDEVRVWLADLLGDHNRLAALTAPSAVFEEARVDVERLTRRMKAITDALTQLTVDRAMNPDLVPVESYVAARDQLAAERAALAERVAAAEVPARRERPPAAVYLGLSEDWDVLDAALRRDWCRDVIARVDVLLPRRGLLVPPKPRVTVWARWEG